MNIYIGNLPVGITEEELLQEFIEFGQVKSVSLMNDVPIGSGQSRVCGFVEMVSTIAGNAAILHLQGALIKGHKLTIIESLPVTKHTNNNTLNTPMTLIPGGFSRNKKHKLNSTPHNYFHSC